MALRIFHVVYTFKQSKLKDASFNSRIASPLVPFGTFLLQTLFNFDIFFNLLQLVNLENIYFIDSYLRIHSINNKSRLCENCHQGVCYFSYSIWQGIYLVYCSDCFSYRGFQFSCQQMLKFASNVCWNRCINIFILLKFKTVDKMRLREGTSRVDSSVRWLKGRVSAWLHNKCEKENFSPFIWSTKFCFLWHLSPYFIHIV